jgi:hypothetical protein
VLFNRVFALFHPDYTVGSGISPDLLTLNKRLIQTLAGSKNFFFIPPVGNRTPPREQHRALLRDAMFIQPVVCEVE